MHLRRRRCAISTTNRGSQIGPTRFAVATHALVWMAQTGGVIPSASIAGQLKSHATFLRRVLSPLVQAGMVDAREGRDGGYFLGRPPEKITLAEVYRAVKAEGADPCPSGEPDVACDGVGKGIELALEEVMAETEEQVVAFLKGHTIADLVRRAEALDRAR